MMNKLLESDFNRSKQFDVTTPIAENPFSLPTINKRNHSLMTAGLQTAQPQNRRRRKKDNSLRLSQRTRGDEEGKRTNYLTINVDENAIGQSVDA